MPESPEVQELASFLGERVTGRTIRAMDIVLAKALKTPLATSLSGYRITRVSRLGKMLDVETSDSDGEILHVVVHFGHDGWVLWHDTAPEGLRRVREATLMARIRLDDGSGFDLTDAGQWKSLSVHVVPLAADVPAVAKLGLDPLADEYVLLRFARVLSGRRKQIKALLQDQAAFAGIGNAYSDEILHAACISPLTHAAGLDEEDVAHLAEQTRTVLRAAATARRGIPPADLRAAKHAALRVHRRAGAPCPECGDTIREHTFSGAAAQYCPTCQTEGVELDA